MAKHIPVPPVTEFQAKGSPEERFVEDLEVRDEVRTLIYQMPQRNVMRRHRYIDRLASDTCKGRLDLDIFNEFMAVLSERSLHNV
jgi:hypothetical protein